VLVGVRVIRFASLFATAALAFGASLPGIPRAVAAVDPTLSGDAIVRTAPGEAASVAAFARRAGATDVTALAYLDVVTAHLDAAATRTLAANVSVRVIASDSGIAAMDLGPQVELQQVGGGDAKKSDRAGFMARSLRGPTPTAGAGVTVAVVDSGVAPLPELAGKIVASASFVNDGATSPDPGGHGTFVAGLIAGTTTGVDPNAKIVSLRILDARGVGTVGKALGAFDWLLHNRAQYGVKVVNLSWGAKQHSSYNVSILAAAVESLWFAGMTVVAAAGNDGPAAGSINMPGADPFVITVGALDQAGSNARNDDREASWSSRGPTLFDGFAKPDVLAPGEGVVSLRVPGSFIDTGKLADDERSEYMTMSGTSVATALVSGVAALLIEIHPTFRPDHVKTALVATAQNVRGSSTPALNAARALAYGPGSRGKLANAGLHPSTLLLKVLQLSLAGANISWENISWENVTWETITWENISWETLMWESVTWESITWESVTWESLTWESLTWESLTWEARVN